MKNILITGASSGIGAATAQLLAAQGHQVLLGARRTERLAELVKEIEAERGRADHQELDVTSLESMRALAATAQEKYGWIDVLVNNAGVMPLSLVQDLRVPASAVAGAIAFAMAQPDGVDVGEVVVRSTVQG